MKTRTSHRSLMALALVAGMSALAMAPVPGLNWRTANNMGIVRKKPLIGNMKTVHITNQGLDTVVISAKGMTLGTIPAGEFGSISVVGFKAVRIRDAGTMPGGSRGTIVWAN